MITTGGCRWHLVEVKHAPKHPVLSRTGPTKDYVAQTVDSAKVEKS